jgi:cyanophycinase-like exopeptidase
MILKIFLIFFVYLCLPLDLASQKFYRTGADTNIVTTPEFGILLAGGRNDNNNGMRWLTQKANGGDVVVLRANDSDGYNDYIYSQLGATVNSVTTIVITSSAQAGSEEVCKAVRDAEMVFIAGGNQWNYYNHWKGTCLQKALNDHVNIKSAPIGGTSAGLAVLGEVVYTAQNNTVFSSEALSNPFHSRVTLAKDFLSIPFMENVITDSHYDDRDRNGRHVVFLARIIKDWGLSAMGIGVNEYTAVGVESNGIAKVFGSPSHPDYAYFIRGNSDPEICEPGIPLTWNNQGNALSVYRIKGNQQGNGAFNLNNWEDVEGGEWFRWYVESGNLYKVTSTGFNPGYIDTGIKNDIFLFPNPARNFIILEKLKGNVSGVIRVYDLKGQLTIEVNLTEGDLLLNNNLDISHLESGLYFIRIYSENVIHSGRFIKL